MLRRRKRSRGRVVDAWWQTPEWLVVFSDGSASVTRELFANSFQVERQRVPGIIGFRVRGSISVIGDVHPPRIAPHHLQGQRIELGERMDEDRAREGWIVGISAEVVTFQAGLLRPVVALVNDNDVSRVAGE